MPLKIELPNDDVKISLDEFLSIVDSKNCNFDNQESILEIAPHLKHLSHNKRFLIEKNLEDLKDLANFQLLNYYGPQVFMLHTCDKYFVRANVWRTVSQLENSIDEFKYDICHDHNFDILTVGYLGPGYRARTYTYDITKVEGLLGEKVPMEAEGILTLEEGCVLLYRAKKDIHIQMPPDDLSVSLNFIPRNRKIDLPQFQFNEENSTICRYLHSSGKELVVRLAGLLGDENTFDVLDTIAQRHHSPHLRALAALSQIQIAPDKEESVYERLIKQGTVVERFIVDVEKENYGRCLTLWD
ncbi:MAG: hypothetical protein ACFB4I_18720 [Cyanophyceae cyanobacterium]